MRYFTSDFHINSTNILRYAKRPFSDWREAATKLIESCNDVAGEDDVIIHVGDLIMTSADRHDNVEDTLPENAYSAKSLKREIEASFITLAGNHDDGHSCETDAKMMVLDLNQNWRNVTVGHYPSTSSAIAHSHSGRKTATKWSYGYCGFKGTEQHPHVHLCGHVHQRWLVSWDEKNHVMNVNVGCDVWDYKPVRDAEITELLDYIWNGKVQAPDEMDREMFETWKLANEKHLEAERIFKKQARYAKKGLTPEICQMRKEEALRKKGLL